MSRVTQQAALLAGLVFSVAPFSMAADPATTTATKEVTPVHLVHLYPSAAGLSKATESGRVRGYDTVTYRLTAQAGEQVKIRLESTNTSNYFNVTAAGKDEALFVGAMSGDQAAFTAGESGDLLIMVYLMRNAARRGESASYTLSIEKLPAK